MRELENLIQRTVVLSNDECIEAQHLPQNVLGGKSSSEKEPSTFKLAKQRVIENFEREYIIGCLSRCKGNITHAARQAGMNVKNFHVKMKKYGIDPKSINHG